MSTVASRQLLRTTHRFAGADMVKNDDGPADEGSLLVAVGGLCAGPHSKRDATKRNLFFGSVFGSAQNALPEEAS